MHADDVRALIEQATGKAPGKIVAVHLNYPSRCAERGRTPAEASYFLKPSSSLASSGQVERPEGFELLAYEGEVALVIGTTARGVSPDEAWQHVGFVTASNDLGLQDLRAADKGSNVRSKGADGCTPLGPQLIEARSVRPDGLRVRTWLDGELVQDDTTETLLFGFEHLIADLTRTITLEPGDVILTGTRPAPRWHCPARRSRWRSAASTTSTSPAAGCPPWSSRRPRWGTGARSPSPPRH